MDCNIVEKWKGRVERERQRRWNWVSFVWWESHLQLYSHRDAAALFSPFSSLCFCPSSKALAYRSTLNHLFLSLFWGIVALSSSSASKNKFKQVLHNFNFRFCIYDFAFSCCCNLTSCFCICFFNFLQLFLVIATRSCNCYFTTRNCGFASCKTQLCFFYFWLWFS